MLLADVVATSEAVASTRSRTAKIDALATLLARSTADEIATIVGFLVGQPRQGRIGIGWATLAAVRDSAVSDANGEPLTVADVDTAISTLQTTTGKGSVGARRDALTAVFGRATEVEADFVVRLFTGELRQGALAGLMYDAIAKAAAVPAVLIRRATMFSGDLGETARIARTGGAPALEEIALVVLRPVLPMLAASAPNVEEALRQTGLASVEWKLDGARIQVHRRGEDVRIYTRNLNDITERLPEVVRVALEFPSEAFVLDGEAIGVDDDAKPHVFQDTMSRFGRDDASSHAMTMSAFFFDVLHADGEDVLDRPLRDRAHVLRRIVGDLRVPAIETDDAALAAAFLEQALTTGHEGVMVKALDSTYDAGRRGGSWRKVKPVRTLDLVVLAAEWGHGRRRGWLSNLHLGARDPETGDFVMVGKTFKGLTDELLTWQTERLQEIADREEGITVYVRPELVVEIALDGVQASTRYAGGVALRFARVRAYRPDKSPEDADTIATVRALRAGAQ
ncbi:MAG TPA: ATP-dependent DNA ligase [Acidimicrobiia bacterium]|jgi:DNA ligase-1|nr:ATP-dependent DNA ligase [Acidimicrobiia bacterium]